MDNELKELTDEMYIEMKNSNSYISWSTISEEYILSEDIIREFKDYVDWFYISQNQCMSFEFIIEFIEYILFGVLYSNKKINLTCKQWIIIKNLRLKDLSNETYNEMKNKDEDDYDYWFDMSYEYRLSEDIIMKFKDKWDWHSISIYQVLPESFIRYLLSHSNKYFLQSIVETQNLSFEFIIEFLNDIDLWRLKQNKNLDFTPQQWATIETLKQMHKN